MTEKLELLSPAKDVATAKAAILAGADGIFIGAPAFGAREAAGNSLEDLKDLCLFAKRFGVKIHVTLNTLLYDHELDQVQELIVKLAQIGVGALIVQDLSVFTMNIPQGLELHASTQCDLSSPEKLKFYQSLGITQAVLPRELTLDDISLYHKTCPSLILEAFVSGALCVGQSGICHISELLKKRSANRGRCAQICRLPMTLKQDGKILATGHLLSLKDNYQGNNLESLVKAGIRSFKIEGRLKDRFYVVNQTADLRLKLDKLIANSQGAYVRSSFGKSTISFIPDVNKTFNRGFTDDLLFGRNLNLSEPKTPKFQGPKVAKVIAVKNMGNETELILQTFPKVSLSAGDGLDFFAEDHSLKGFRVNSVKTCGNKVKVLAPGRVNVALGVILRRNQDLMFEKLLTSDKAVSRRVDYSLTLSVLPNQRQVELEVSDECGRHALKTLDFTFDPQLPALNQDKLKQVLSKRLDDQSRLVLLQLKGDLNVLTVPISKINALRRAVLSACFEQERPKANKVFNPQLKLKWPEIGVDPRLELNRRAVDLLEQAEAHRQNCPSLVLKSVMTCKFCLVNKYGKCTKKGGVASGYTLEVSGESFKIFCDCKQCRMHLLT